MQEKSIIKQNILQYLNFIGVTPYKFYQETGITRGVLTQNNGMSEENTTKFLAYYKDVNPEWLLTGKGDMLKDNNIIKSYLKPDKQERQLPLIPIEAIAGFGAGEFTIMEHDVLEYYKIPEFSSADFLIPVKGSSMQPKYYGGDILACRLITSWDYFQYGVPHVITLRDRGTVVKRIQKGINDQEYDLISDNEKYQPFTIKRDDLVNIAIVVGVIRVEN